ncbi:hypothetical protein PYCCODRAFT_1221981 [Trametes coccinea BRFM310]|uniref:Aip3p/Bud6 N-terminal domain-containing protein n=1 Tax=Trametes coccinea (strain BRFM310) TaxID=1353009 RepID=A0A1Y2IW03_TRAC3|nr:hypothetical protein PYCCODRAFT_1221981 [Trametes coccinea BRFM310]
MQVPVHPSSFVGGQPITPMSWPRKLPRPTHISINTSRRPASADSTCTTSSSLSVPSLPSPISPSSSTSSLPSPHSARPESEVQRAVSRLLSLTKQLQEVISLWAHGSAGNADVSDAFVLVGSQFDSTVHAFWRVGVDMRHALHSTCFRLFRINGSCAASATSRSVSLCSRSFDLCPCTRVASPCPFLLRSPSLAACALSPRDSARTAAQQVTSPLVDLGQRFLRCGRSAVARLPSSLHSWPVDSPFTLDSSLCSRPCSPACSPPMPLCPCGVCLCSVYSQLRRSQSLPGFALSFFCLFTALQYITFQLAFFCVTLKEPSSHRIQSCSDLFHIPLSLRSLLEGMLAEKPSPDVLAHYSPRIRKLVVDLLQGLQAKQSPYWAAVARTKDSNRLSVMPGTTVRDR